MENRGGEAGCARRKQKSDQRRRQVERSLRRLANLPPGEVEATGSRSPIVVFDATVHSVSAAPRMLSRSSFWMSHQKMMQYMEQGKNMILVAAALRQSNVANDHVSNNRAAVLAG